MKKGHNIKFFLSDNLMAPTTISGYLFAHAMEKAGYLVEIVTDVARKKEILHTQEATTIIFQKKIYQGHRYEDIHHVKGRIKLVHIDDDFAGMNEPHHLKTLACTDLILVGNKGHKDKMHHYIQTPVEVITSISDFDHYPFMPPEKKNKSPIVISWQQNLADVYVEDLLTIAEPLKKLHQKYGIALKLYGWHEGKHYNVPDRRQVVLQHLPFAQCISFVPYEVYLKTTVKDIATSHIHIVVYKPSDERLGKSGFGLRRMMMLGLPCVVTCFGNNTQLIENGKTGYLVNTTQEWYEALEKLILDEALRYRLSKNARSFVEDAYSYDKTVAVFIDALKKHHAL